MSKLSGFLFCTVHIRGNYCIVVPATNVFCACCSDRGKKTNDGLDTSIFSNRSLVFPLSAGASNL